MADPVGGEAATTPATTPSEQQPVAQEQARLIEEHLAIGKTLLERGQYVEAQARFRAILQLDATHPEALRLMTKAQQRLEAQRAEAERGSARMRRLAEQLAIKVAREKASAQAKREAEAREQVAQAREQQLKLLYTKGMAFYRRGNYQEAIDTFQQMVLLDPAHPLIRETQRLITQAEAKQAEARARARAKPLTPHGPANVPELEQQLTVKRMEIETGLKYVRVALKDRKFDLALDLVQKVLVQDPENREAQQLLSRVQEAKLEDESARLKQQVEHDERRMVQDVIRAQVLPESKPVQWLGPAPAEVASQGMAAALRVPMSLDFTDVALTDVIQFIADTASISIIPSPQLDLKSRRVSLKVTELPLELALKYLMKHQSLAYRVDHDAILIATEEEFSNEPLETRVFFLNKGLGPFTLETTAIESNKALPMESMKDLIEQTVPQPPESKLVVDERSGALIITNTPENFKLVEQLLSQLDVTPLQVLIEARFVELTMTGLEQLGLESVLTGDYPLSKEKAAEGGFGPGHLISKSGGFKFPDLSRQDEGANLTLEGVLTGLQFESVLHALEETKKSKTLSAPRVTALNNQTAQIRVVEEFNYPTRYEVSLIQFDSNGDGDFDDAGETEFANVPKDLQKRDIGILLNVTPSVGKDLKTITLVIAPEVSQFSQFRSLGGGVTVPEFTSSQLTTSVIIENGQTVVLGGLMKDTTSEQVTKIPVLGDLPFVGGLFRQKKQSNTRKNLLIFITARLLAPRGQTT